MPDIDEWRENKEHAGDSKCPWRDQPTVATGFVADEPKGHYGHECPH